MNPKHVTNLELSKKLKELGVPQESEFYWFGVDGFALLTMDEAKELFEDNEIEQFTYYSAFLASELGEMLPFEVIVEKKNTCFKRDFMKSTV